MQQSRDTQSVGHTCLWSFENPHRTSVKSGPAAFVNALANLLSAIVGPRLNSFIPSPPVWYEILQSYSAFAAARPGFVNAFGLSSNHFDVSATWSWANVKLPAILELLYLLYRGNNKSIWRQMCYTSGDRCSTSQRVQ